MINDLEMLDRIVELVSVLFVRRKGKHLGRDTKESNADAVSSVSGSYELQPYTQLVFFVPLRVNIGCRVSIHVCKRLELPL